MAETDIDAELVQVGEPNEDGFCLYHVALKGSPDMVLGFVHASVAQQKGFRGNTLRVLDFGITDAGFDTLTHLTVFFVALFKWNKTDNIKFYCRKKEFIFQFRLFGETLIQDRKIESVEFHNNWVIYRGINQGG